MFFFVLFLVNNLRNFENIFPHFGSDQFTPLFNLPKEHALIRVLVYYRKIACNVAEYVEDPGFYFNEKF